MTVNEDADAGPRGGPCSNLVGEERLSRGDEGGLEESSSINAQESPLRGK